MNIRKQCYHLKNNVNLALANLKIIERHTEIIFQMDKILFPLVKSFLIPQNVF